MPTEDRDYNFMNPLVLGWNAKIGQSRRAKSQFTEIAKQCEQFYSADLGFMWSQDFKEKYMGGNINPKFKITVAKAFELVAVIGPVLFWRYPNRIVRKIEDEVELSPELFGDPEDEQTLQMFEEIMREQTKESAVNRTRNSLMEKYLNYSQREQPNGLSFHSQLAITEALVKGRGCLKVESYSFPDSDRTLTGAFWFSVDDLFIDPDASDPGLSDAKWIAIRHVDTTWDLEKKFDLVKGSLKDKATLSSPDNADERSQAKSLGETHDLIVWYEIYSKSGVGTKLKNVHSTLGNAFDDVVGDYAYICMSPSVPFPLNAPLEKVKKASDEEVSEMFQWPVPLWKDSRFPVALIDFYPRPGSVWPLAPMAMGLGELMFMNVIISMLANRIYQSSREIIAYLRSAAQNIESQLRSDQWQSFIEINDVANQSNLNNLVQFMDRPNVNTDVFHLLEMVSEMFDKRVGLTELLYGLHPGGTASRTATDIQAKQEMVSVRPDYMAGRVEDWQSEVANLEKYVARWDVTGKDIKPLLGTVGSHLWTKLVTDEDPEIVFREMKAMVEAGSVRKPNKARDVKNLTDAASWLMPELSRHADATGDTGPLNNFIVQLGEAYDMDMTGLTMGERKPPEPPPEVLQQQQELAQLEAQMEQAKSQAELQKLQADVQKANLDLQKAQLEVQEQGLENQEAQIDLQEAMLNLNNQGPKQQQEAMKFQQELAKKEADLQFDILKKQLELRHAQRKRQDEGQAQVGQHVQRLLQDLQKHQQEQEQDEERHEQELRQDQESHLLDLVMRGRSAVMDLQQDANKVRTARELSDVKTEAARKKAATNGASTAAG